MPYRLTPGPLTDPNDEPTDLSEPARHELVAEAAAIFGEEAARDLATQLRVPFEPPAPQATL